MLFTFLINYKVLYTILCIFLLGFICYWYKSTHKTIIVFEPLKPGHTVLYDNDLFESILNVFKKHNACATFFIISSLVDEIMETTLVNAVRNGHHLANCGKYNSLHYLQTKEQLAEEILHCDQMIKKIYSLANKKLPVHKYFRPSFGTTSKIITDYCKENGYEIVFGYIYPFNLMANYSSMYRKFLPRQISADDITILHDANYTPELLDNLEHESRRLNCYLGGLMRLPDY